MPISLAKSVNTVTFGTALKPKGKNSENMSSKIYNFSIMQNIRMQYELYKRLDRKKRDKPGVVVFNFNPSTWEAEEGRFLSLRPAWSTE